MAVIAYSRDAHQNTKASGLKLAHTESDTGAIMAVIMIFKVRSLCRNSLATVHLISSQSVTTQQWLAEEET